MEALEARYRSDPELERAIEAAIDPWLAHMAWRTDFAAWRHRRLWQERSREVADRVTQVREALGGRLEGARILDLGAGMGGLTVALLAAGARAVALDYNRAYGRITRLRGRRYGLEVPALTGAGERLPFRDEAFDLVLCWDVLEHVQDPEALVAEIARVLRPGGRVLLTAINRFAWIDPHYHLAGVNWLPRPWAEAYIRLRGRGKEGAAFRDRQRLSEMHYYTYGGIRRLLARYGLEARDLREARLEARRLGGLPGLLQRLGLARPAYRLHRALWAGAFRLEARKVDGRTG